MQKSAISWTKVTWNPVAGCSIVSDGCKHCYAATLSEKYGWTKKPWTLQNEEENVVIKPHKLGEPYLLKEPSKVFVNSMSDLFHRVIPDWYRAVVFCVMLDNPQHIFQVLTKRSESPIDWHERFMVAIKSDEFKEFAITLQNTKSASSKSKVLNAMGRAMRGEFTTPWGENIWQGVSVEDVRVLHRIDDLRKCQAKVRFISAEPLLGAFGKVDFTDIHWVIVGGESGNHMKEGHPRWMKQEWAREIKEQCVAQGVAYFYKQDSGIRTEMRTYLIEEDGSKWVWQQYPGELTPPWPFGEEPPTPPAPDSKPETRLVNFQDVKEHWNKTTQQWDSEDFVYIGRANLAYKLPHSMWANPFKLDSTRARDMSIQEYREYAVANFNFTDLEQLRGKTLVCWCSPLACHGDILLELLGQPSTQQPANPEPVKVSEQMSLFGDETLRRMERQLHLFE